MHSIDNFKGQGVAVCARERPQLAVLAPLDLGNEAATALRYSGG
jgi:hypothetical protein